MSTGATELPRTSTIMATKATDRPRSTKEAEKCFLLDLPGGKYQRISNMHVLLTQLAELRNRIYHFAAEEGRITYLPHRLRIGYTEGQLREYLGESELDKRVPDFLNLTRVCRQIRAEFSPIYAAETEIHVCHLDIDEFTSYHFPHMARDNDTEPAGNLVIDCRFPGFDDEEDDDPCEPHIDMLPFLEYCRIRPGLKVKCGRSYICCHSCSEGWADVTKVMDVLFALASNKKLQDWLSDTIEKVNISCSPALSLFVKEGKAVEWMKQRNSGDEDPATQEWMRRVGFRSPEWDNLMFSFKASGLY
jgi:hypothetical protein